MLHREEFFSAGDGLRLYQQHWLPDGDARATVIVVPGLSDHSARHARLAEELCGRGYGVYAMDLRGHGCSDGPRCYIGSFDEYLDDLDVLVDEVRCRESGKPLFLFGHSMGGLVVSAWAIARQPALAGLILSGPLLRVPDRIYPGLRHVAGLMSRLTPRWRLLRIDFSRISRDPQAVARFHADPLVFHGRLPVRTGAEILRAVRLVSEHRQRVRLPLLILHGAADELCDPEGSRELYQHAASSDKTLRLYEGLFHDVQHDPGEAQVRADLVDWLDQRCGEQPAKSWKAES